MVMCMLTLRIVLSRIRYGAVGINLWILVENSTYICQLLMCNSASPSVAYLASFPFCLTHCCLCSKYCWTTHSCSCWLLVEVPGSGPHPQPSFAITVFGVKLQVQHELRDDCDLLSKIQLVTKEVYF